MNRNQAEEQLKKLFGQVEDDDYSTIEEFVENNENECDDDLEEMAFRQAVIGGHKEYVFDHVDDVDLNDGDGYSTYLYDAPDSEMEKILIDAGAFRSWDDYDGYSLAIETINGTVLSFTNDFQRKVYEKFLLLYNLSEDDILKFLNGEMDEEPVLPEPLEEYGIEEICDILNIEIEDDSVTLTAYEYGDNAGDLMEFIETLGWEFDFEGESWKLETNGVYFINE